MQIEKVTGIRLLQPYLLGRWWEHETCSDRLRAEFPGRRCRGQGCRSLCPRACLPEHPSKHWEAFCGGDLETEFLIVTFWFVSGIGLVQQRSGRRIWWGAEKVWGDQDAWKKEDDGWLSLNGQPIYPSSILIQEENTFFKFIKFFWHSCSRALNSATHYLLFQISILRSQWPNVRLCCSSVAKENLAKIILLTYLPPGWENRPRLSG